MGVSAGTLTAADSTRRHTGQSFAGASNIFVVQVPQYPPWPQGISTWSGTFSRHIIHVASPLESVVDVVVLSPAHQCSRSSYAYLHSMVNASRKSLHHCMHRVATAAACQGKQHAIAQWVEMGDAPCIAKLVTVTAAVDRFLLRTFHRCLSTL